MDALLGEEDKRLTWLEVQAPVAGLEIMEGHFRYIDMVGQGPLGPVWTTFCIFETNPGVRRHTLNIPKNLHFAEPRDLAGEEVVKATRWFVSEVVRIVALFDEQPTSH